MSDTNLSNSVPSTPAGWYPIPELQGYQGYWNGTTWEGNPVPIIVSSNNSVPSAPPLLETKPVSAVGNTVAILFVALGITIEIAWFFAGTFMMLFLAANGTSSSEQAWVITAIFAPLVSTLYFSIKTFTNISKKKPAWVSGLSTTLVTGFIILLCKTMLDMW